MKRSFLRSHDIKNYVNYMILVFACLVKSNLVFAGNTNSVDKIPNKKNAGTTHHTEIHKEDESNVPKLITLITAGDCDTNTVNRFTGSYHSNFYIGNHNGTNILLAWGYNMATFTTLPGNGGTKDIWTPTVVTASLYAGNPIEVRSSSTGGGTPPSTMLLRTSTKLYAIGESFTGILGSWSGGFGGTTIGAASDITTKLPSGIGISDIAKMAISNTAIGLVTTTGAVYMISKNVNLIGDGSGSSTGTAWHQVKKSDGTFLTGVSKFSLSSSGAFALTKSGSIYYWGAAANNATTYNKANDMSALIPAGQSVTDLVVLGASKSALFLLCSDKKVYSCGINTYGVIGDPSKTVDATQATFITVKGTDGTTPLANISSIDGNTEADKYSMGAMDSDGRIYGWGDNSAALLGQVNNSTNSQSTPTTVQIFGNQTGFKDFAISGHFSIGFYTGGATDQYWYVGHSITGSQGTGEAAGSTQYVSNSNPTKIDASPLGISFDCSNTQATLTSTVTSLSAFSSCKNIASATQSFSVSGRNLSDIITLTPPVGFEISTSSGGPFRSDYITISQSNQSVASTLIYVRSIASATITSLASRNITITSPGATDLSVAVTGTNNDLPSITATGPNSRSGSGTIGITATPSSGTIDWYAGSTGGSALASGQTSYTTVSLTNTTSFYAEARIVATGCVSTPRSEVIATINGSLSAGSIGSNAAICNGATPSTLTSVANASNGTGTKVYQWEVSTVSSTSGFSVIGSSNATTYSPGALIATTYYRRGVQTSVDAITYSNVITITVNSLPTLSTPGNNARTGTGLVILTAVPSSGATIDWYDLTTAGLLLYEGNATYTPNVSSTTTFYAQARNATTGCISALPRLGVIATINGGFGAGTIASGQVICTGATPNALTSSSSASGGTGAVTYSWEVSTVSSIAGYTVINSATSTSYTPPSINTTSYYRRGATTSEDGTIFSNIVTITVNQPITPVILSTQSSDGLVTLNATAANVNYSWSGGDSRNTAINNFKRSGTYTITYSNSNNCATSLSVDVAVKLMGISRNGQLLDVHSSQVNRNGTVSNVTTITNNGEIKNYFGLDIITQDLLLFLDASDVNSYIGSGPTVYDQSGKNANGTIHGAVTFVSDNNQSYFDFPTANNENYIKSTLTQDYQDFMIILKPDASLASTKATVLSSGLTDNRAVLFSNVVGSGSDWTISNTGTSTDWINSSSVYYINGVPGNTLAAGWNSIGGFRTNQTGTFASPFTYYLGAGLNAYPFKGKIAFLIMYSRRLTANEHLQNYKALKSRFSLP